VSGAAFNQQEPRASRKVAAEKVAQKVFYAVEKSATRAPLILLRTWKPSQSPLSIEYSDELLRALELDDARIETTGILYGSYQAGVARLLPLQPDASPIGIYVVRARGEVFLSESNLDLFHRRRALIALVIAGAKAGFFVHGFDGSLQSVRSFEEFRVPQLQRRRSSAVSAVGLFCLASLPIAAFAYLHPMHSSGLSVREDGDRVRISWNAGRAGVLRISDGGKQTAIPFSPNQSSADYIRQGRGDVKVVLTLTRQGR
jgi:hypothetical protein